MTMADAAVMQPSLETKRQADLPVAGNTATGWLKIIALVFMFIDHSGKMLFPSVPEMRILGRIAFPLYAWCLVVGFCYTRSVPKYLLRLLGVGLVSQGLYMLALNHTWKEPNIFLTLCMGLLALWGLRENRYGSAVWAPVLALLAAVLTGCDYGWKGVLFIILLYACRGSRPSIAAVMAAFCLYWGSISGTVTRFFALDFQPLISKFPWSSLIGPWMRLQTLAILALPLILIRFPRDCKLPKWVGYGIYPAHLALLYLLELIQRSR